MTASDDWKGVSLMNRRPTKVRAYFRGMSAVKDAIAERSLANATHPTKTGGTRIRPIRASAIGAAMGGRQRSSSPPVVTTALSMSSREIADLCENRHDNAMADINKMLMDIGLDVLTFQGIYKNARNRDHTEYLLPKGLTVTHMTGYRADLRYKVMNRLEELESRSQSFNPSNIHEHPAAMRGLTTTVLCADGSEKITEQVRITAKGFLTLAKLIQPTARLDAQIVSPHNPPSRTP